MGGDRHAAEGESGHEITVCILLSAIYTGQESSDMARPEHPDVFTLSRPQIELLR